MEKISREILKKALKVNIINIKTFKLFLLLFVISGITAISNPAFDEPGKYNGEESNYHGCIALQKITKTQSPRQKGKRASAGYWMHENVEEIKGLDKMGPFVRMKDGSIVTVTGTSKTKRDQSNDYKSCISKDEGKTWTEEYPIFTDTNQVIIRRERALFVTSEGVIVLSFMNQKEYRSQGWQEDIHDSPNARLPTYVVRSLDGGRTWQDLQKLHDDHTGAVRDIIETRDGNIIISTMMLRHNPGRHTVVTYTSKDKGISWIRSNVIDLGGVGHHGGVTEATIEQLTDGRIWMLIRTNWGSFWEAFSDDEGFSWKDINATSIDASGSPGMLKRLKSGRLVLVWNRKYPEGKTEYPLEGAGERGYTGAEVPTSFFRDELSMMFSIDDGKTWSDPVVIARGLCAYPWIFEANPGELWITNMYPDGVRLKLNEKDFIPEKFLQAEREADELKKTGKMTSNGKWIPNNAEELQGLKMGPFVRLQDGSILTVDGSGTQMGENCCISMDEGRTWAEYPIFANPSNYAIRPERALLQTRKGVTILAFSNNREMSGGDWNEKIHDMPGAILPTYTVRSTDGGKTWKDLQKLHDSWTGAIRDIIETRDGNIIFTSMMMQHDPGRHSVVTYTSKDEGRSWIRSNVIDLGGVGHHAGVTEATIEQLSDGRIWMLMRTNWGKLWEAYSEDEGLTWKLFNWTGIDASGSPAMLQRLQSGKLVLVWNRMYPEGKTEYPLSGGDGHLSEVPASFHRDELSIMFSGNDGKSWSQPVVIARKGMAYPYVFEANPGELWITTMQGGLRIKLNEKDFLK